MSQETSPPVDLSRLRINRDRPARGTMRALRVSLAIAACAVILIAILWALAARQGTIEVQVAVAEVVGGQAHTAGSVVTANGYVVARTKASVSSKIAGRLEFLSVSEGSFIKKGDVLAQLENRDYAAALDAAEADLSRARAGLAETEADRDQWRRDAARAEELVGRGLVSAQEAETTRSRLAAAEARVRLGDAQVAAAEAAVGVARANLENTRIRAPFDGTVLRKDAEVGEVVAPAVAGGGLTRGAVVTMADLSTLEVEVDVNESYIARIRDAQPARIVLDAYPDAEFKGRVRQVVPTADRQRATVLVKVSILERDSRILPEMGARVEFLEMAAAAAESGAAAPDSSPHVIVPASAVRDEGGQAMVWIVSQGRLERREVEAAPVSGGRREIRRGLSGGEQVVVGGPERLRAGARARLSTS